MAVVRKAVRKPVAETHSPLCARTPAIESVQNWAVGIAQLVDRRVVAESSVRRPWACVLSAWTAVAGGAPRQHAPKGAAVGQVAAPTNVVNLFKAVGQRENSHCGGRRRDARRSDCRCVVGSLAELHSILELLDTGRAERSGAVVTKWQEHPGTANIASHRPALAAVFGRFIAALCVNLGRACVKIAPSFARTSETRAVHPE